MGKKPIKYLGTDCWGREVFTTARGSLLCDVSLDYTRRDMSLYSKSNNEFEGEPDYPVDAEEFVIVNEF